MSRNKIITVVALLLSLSKITYAQQSCNKFGAWLWYLELTKFKSYESLADTLASLGVKRIYIKVANGKIDSAKWTEINDKSVPAIFAERGIEAWAWSYNYPGNEARQAEALYRSAKAGYKGYVVDIESQYDGKPVAARNLFLSFENAKNRARNEGVISDDFPLYCTTWGNPTAHRFPIATINQYVDAFMPQTYVENWGAGNIITLESTIDNVNEEYRLLGSTKPVHHIVSTEKGIMSAHEVNRFMTYAGPESSVWPIPGTNTSLFLWNTWNDLAWNYDYCSGNRDVALGNTTPRADVNVKTHGNEIHVNEPVASIQILNSAGAMVGEILNPGGIVDVSHLIRGKYLLSIVKTSGENVMKLFSKR
jgi:hypothetical protein